MQLFFPVPSAAYSLLAAITNASLTAESLAKEIHDHPPYTAGAFALALLLGQLLAIVSHWIASKPVAGESGTLGNAFKVWLLIWVLLIATGLVSGIGYVFLLHTRGLTVLLFLLGGLLLFIVVGFLIPMRVYEIGVFGALGFFVLSAIVALVLNFALSLAFIGQQTQVREFAKKFSALSQPEQQQFFAALFHEYGLKTGDVLPGELEAADRSKTPQERLAALKTMYAELQKRREAIDPKDKAAVAGYEAERARYDELLKNLQSDAAATRR
jgi:hypothetical protein